MTRINETLLLETHLSDLRSDDLLLRELAVAQLSRFTHFPQTITALKEADKQENNKNLSKQIRSLIRMVEVEKETLDPTLPEPDYSDYNSITGDWQTHEISLAEELYGVLSKLSAPDMIKAAVAIVDAETELYRLVPFFTWPPEFVTKPDLLSAFTNRLKDNDNIFTLRLISFLSVHSPAILTKNLQTLLRSKNSLVRSEAIKFLFKVSRPHAMRLLEELILSSEKNRRSASTFLLLLPFNDIKHVVLSLIECGSLRDTFLQKLIYHLVYNNPDMDFFKRLTVIELLRKDEIPEISALRSDAAEALFLADMIKEDRSVFCRNSLVKIADYIRSRSGIALKIDASIERTADADIPPEPVATKHAALAEPDESYEIRLARLLSQDSLSAENKNLVISLLGSAQTEQDKTMLLKVLYKFKPGDAAVISWLEESLGSSAAENSIIILKLLAELSPTQLLPHLPVLCLSGDEPVSIHAIRLFRKHNPKLFLKQIDKWLHEDREVTWKAARAAMLMMRIEDSRSILTQAFYSTQRVSLIKFFAPIFRVSPDHITLYELERLLDTCRGKKREVLQEEILLLKEALGLISQTETKSGDNTQMFAALQIKWDEFCKGLETIHYISRSQKFKDILLIFFHQHQVKLAMLLVLALALLFWPDTELSRQTIDTSQSLKTEFKLNKQPPVVEVGEIKVFELESYDPINRFWQARSLNGDIFKLKLANFSNFKKGYKGNFRITDYRVSPLGYPIVACTPSN